jgi:hypothetical protein
MGEFATLVDNQPEDSNLNSKRKDRKTVSITNHEW